MSAITTSLKVGPGDVKDVELVRVTELKTRLKDILNGVSHDKPVVIARNDRPTAVVISIEEFNALVDRIPDPLDVLRQRFSGLLERISAPGAAEAGERVYQALPSEIAAAARAAAKRG